MALFKKSKKNKCVVDGAELLERHKKGELSDESFLKEFKDVTIYYSTPYGDHKDGSKKLFLLEGPDNTGYQPIFISEDHMRVFYENTGRLNYMIMEGTFASVLNTAIKMNKKNIPIGMGLIIEPGHYGVTIDVSMLNIVKGMLQN